MLPALQQRKAKITLSDYPYRRDIENRILMAQLTTSEVNILQEIIHHSLKISIDQLSEEIDLPVESLIPLLDKLSATKLYKRENRTLLVDKDMRKYFEFQLQKFNDRFAPDLEFLQNALNQVPIHVLPLWYALPRSASNIFESIVEKYFLTPKTYLQYLHDLQFDNPVLNAILKDVFQPPHFKVKAQDLMKKYQLSRECLEEYLLLLEYHFACCLSYNQANGYWQEVVTPFAELRNYLIFESQAIANAIKDKIEESHHIEFSFIEDLTTFLKACQTKKVHPTEVKNLKFKTPAMRKRLIDKLLQVEFVKQGTNEQLLATPKGKMWLSKKATEQATMLAGDPLNRLSNGAQFTTLFNNRNLHLIEKKLRKLTPHEWVETDRFIQGFIAPIADKQPVTLKKRGTKWKYEVPTYNELEMQFIRAIVMERLGELGVVNTGLHRGKQVFSLTPFGSHFIH